jgi:hypothetical protein
VVNSFAAPRRAAVNLFAPQAQLLLADRPANDESVGERISRKQRAPGDADGAEHAGAPRADAAALSMVIPRQLLGRAGVGDRLPKEETPLVEVRCAAYDLLPAFATAGAAASVHGLLSSDALSQALVNAA